MTFAPPGSSKSRYCSILFPAWLMARNPDANLICASHTAELALMFSKEVRNLIQRNSKVLGISVREDSSAVQRWSLETGGQYLAVGVGQAVAGYRADMLLIDDPIKSAEDADSEISRENVWRWFKSDIIPRLKPRGRINIIQTRWHELDLSGKIIEEMQNGGLRWDILCLAAQCESAGDPLGREVGQFLWDDDDYGFDDVLRRAKIEQPPRVWNSLYQQRPSAETGTYFLDEWFRTGAKMPPKDELAIYMGADFATQRRQGRLYGDIGSRSRFRKAHVAA